MMWTAFSMLLFLSIGVVASYTFGGFIHLLSALVVIVMVMKIIQGSPHISENFHGNS